MRATSRQTRLARARDRVAGMGVLERKFLQNEPVSIYRRIPSMTVPVTQHNSSCLIAGIYRRLEFYLMYRGAMCVSMYH